MKTAPVNPKLLTDKALQYAAAELGVEASDVRVTPVSGGELQYLTVLPLLRHIY